MTSASQHIRFAWLIPLQWALIALAFLILVGIGVSVLLSWRKGTSGLVHWVREPGDQRTACRREVKDLPSDQTYASERNDINCSQCVDEAFPGLIL
jgi:hypothetical protein